MSVLRRSLSLLLLLLPPLTAGAASWRAVYDCAPDLVVGELLELHVALGNRLETAGGGVLVEDYAGVSLDFADDGWFSAPLSIESLVLVVDCPASARPELLLAGGPAVVVPVLDPAEVVLSFRLPAGVELAADGWRVVVEGGGRDDVSLGDGAVWALDPDEAEHDFFYLLDSERALELGPVETQLSEDNFGAALALTLDASAAAAFAALTAEYIDRPLAVVVGDRVITAPVVREVIEDGRIKLVGLDDDLTRTIGAVLEHPLPASFTLLECTPEPE
ncbi:MAG: hypothetical protein GF403_05620 [Candidatus Coatesbacteria bacterium]|nr:hypothetical protein [Candidatus Coatesbacteria bacterium]